MEQESIQPSNEGEPSLQQFQDEILKFASEEVAGREESGHFLLSGSKTRELNPDFDASKLTEKDWEIWKKIKDGTIAMEEFHPYGAAVAALGEEDETRKPRMLFVAFAGNKAVNAIFEHVFPGKRKESPHFHKA